MHGGGDRIGHEGAGIATREVEKVLVNALGAGAASGGIHLMNSSPCEVRNPKGGQEGVSFHGR